MIQCPAWIAMIRVWTSICLIIFLQRLQILQWVSLTVRFEKLFIVGCRYGLVLNNSNFRRYIIVLNHLRLL